MLKRASALIYAVAIAVLATGFGSSEDAEPAVATAALSVSRERVPIGSPLKLTYRFDVAANARFDGPNPTPRMS